MTLLEVLKTARDRWYFIGQGIGVEDADLNEIEDRHLSDKLMCLHDMLQRRIRRGGLTRSMLCTSLRGGLVGRNDVAREIEAL